ncbi:MAG: serpin family protein [Lachnospiraceae bacterium]|nr:serpin family protein [Lachnospiraceae bacterium]
MVKMKIIMEEMRMIKKNKTRKMTKRIIALTLSFMMIFTGCANSSGKKDNESGDSGYSAGLKNLSENKKSTEIFETSFEKKHVTALSKSGEDILYEIMNEADDVNANYLISPISIQMALGMTASGSAEDTNTRRELMEVLMPGLDEEPAAFDEEMASLTRRMENDADVKWNVANSIWVKDDGRVKLRDTYVSDMAKYYDADIFMTPFDADTLKDINSWVNDNTNKMIPEIIKELSPEARIVLVNALAFDGEWEEAYEDYQISEDEEFTNADGSKSKVTMMSSEEAAAIKLAGGLGFIKPYKGGKFSFVGILPPEGMDTKEYMEKIANDSSGFSEAYLSADYSRDVYADMPEFKTEFGITLDDTLHALGVNEAYSDDAQFFEMITDDSYPVKISTVIHKTLIDVSRNGTKAAAATLVAMDECEDAELPYVEPYIIRLNRPFVYAIVDNESGIPVFLGVQNTMP